jgi:linoleoyl-CoA desaturase
MARRGSSTGTVTMEREASQSQSRLWTDKDLLAHQGQNGTIYSAINGQVYDLTSFIKSNVHPGGTIVRLGSGRDATALVQSYHPSSSQPKVQALLSKHCKNLGEYKPSMPVPKAPEYDAFWRAVSSRVEVYMRERKLSRHPELIAIFETILTVIAFAVCMYFKTVYGSFLAAMVLGWVAGRLGFLMHMGNHAAMSRYPWINRTVGALMDLAGGSSLNWQFDHQVSHHLEPNNSEWDNDANIGAPWIRLHPDTKRSPIHKYQHILAIIAMTGGFFNWYFADIKNFYDRHVGTCSYIPSTRDWAHLIFFKGFWLFLHIGLPMIYGFSFWHAMALILVWMGFGGQYMENTFIVNHIQQGLIPPKGSHHWSTKNVYGSANWASASHFWNWWSAGLNHQIEHHLFPSLSHYYYPEISPLVQQTCKEFNLPYTNFHSFGAAWWSMNNYLRLLGTAHFD